MTIRPAADRLLHGYFQGESRPVVLCAVGGEGPIGNREQVIKAWYLVGGGLLPAAFDHTPDTYAPYFRQMNGRG